MVSSELARSDTAKDLRIYFKGLKFKNIRVPVQRLSVTPSDNCFHTKSNMRE